MKYPNIREEELKNKVAQDYFWLYDCTKIMGNVDFCVCMHQSQTDLTEYESLLWAEAKKGTSDVYHAIVQLILTIGKARTFDKFLPPAMLGAFDGEKIAFIPYNDIQEIFYLNDFNWNVAPSNHSTKEFKLIYQKTKAVISEKSSIFRFLEDDQELQKFIKHNFVVGKFGLTKTKIDKNNFIAVFNKWLVEVKPSIIMNWENAKKKSIIEADFYLADLISEDNVTLKEKLFVRLEKDIYELDRRLNDMGIFDIIYTQFRDKQQAHKQFWNRYERPPKEEYWDYIVERRDLLVPQDVRERKGSFFTPQIWVELSQRYLADVLGENWQDEYYIWDCAAGTGNLLNGLTNKHHIWASTLDKQDVEVMHDRIANGANLLDKHVFQFDFLNDEFVPQSQGGKMPDSLYGVITNPKKCKKLVVYMNPPYAEAGDSKQRTGTGKNKTSVSQNKIHDKYHHQLGDANRQLFAQFLMRIYNEIKNCKIAEFSTLKTLTSSHFSKFRDIFKAKLLKAFIVPAHSFDNVNGRFPIGFKIWNTEIQEKFDEIFVNIFDLNQKNLGTKRFCSYQEADYFSVWVHSFKLKSGFKMGWLQGVTRNDFQNQTGIIIKNDKNQIAVPRGIEIYYTNLIECCVCYAVRMCIAANWLNDCDQFLYPNDNWETDTEFKNNCLIYTLFHEKNTIQSKFGTNHWIPFAEKEVDAQEKFESNFMSKFIKGKLKPDDEEDLFTVHEPKTPYISSPLAFSPEATAVFEAGRTLWKYYHQQLDIDTNASLYDIREYFQGRNKTGKMNNKSIDETYTHLIAVLREKLKELAAKIEVKVYEHGFLKA